MWVLSGGEMGWAVSMDLRRIDTPAELLRIVREAVAYGPLRADGKTPPVMELASPAQTPAGFLTVCVPLDGRMERIARRWALSDDSAWRERAAVVLGARGLEWTWDALKPLLTDPYSRVHTVGNWTAVLEARATRNYPVRDAARRAVAGPVSPVVDADVPEMRYRPVSFGGTALYLAGVIGLAALANRRGLGLCGWACVPCAGLAGLVLLGWWRSWMVVDSVSVAAGGVDWEITATMGEVVVLRVEDGAVAHGPMVWTERVDLSQRLWYSGALTGTDRLGWWFPKVFGGRMWGVQKAYPFVAVVVRIGRSLAW